MKTFTEDTIRCCVRREGHHFGEEKRHHQKPRRFAKVKKQREKMNERERESARVSVCLCVRVPIIDDERAFFPVAQVKQ